ncbi:hypothetical protein SELMODRAFT_425474 [Selaginella moellendorffii]|uniref:cyclin-dependent kinase n=1 Tax=Selaginella moellendorffii TaxID=88036 RepID=D8ST76_SELML|nr:cell division control protein 2 homolog [Selaginella moellendorffii]EFJ12353.1 hypothetical protein SELMODRAFT_425474 [Selaginella moellendorffii]|eukprot:XP_002986496.1 cell division control protein 2 homolog [Selaginella moellendorffii]
MDRYDYSTQSPLLGQGTDGVVRLARNRVTGAMVAVKKLSSKHDAADMMWECATLRACQHKNIIHLHSKLVTEQGLFMVFELMDEDLFSYIWDVREREGKIPEVAVRSIMKQILEALAFVHSKGLIHRDVKSSNVLINHNKNLNNSVVIKLIDFSRVCFASAGSCENMGNVYYRAPELLLGGEKYIYGREIDIWAAGCIFLELLTGFPFGDDDGNFPPNSELDVMNSIVKWIGPVDETTWKGVNKLENYNTYKSSFPRNPSNLLQSRLGDSPAYDLLRKMLCLNPRERITAKEALESDYFKTSVWSRVSKFLYSIFCTTLNLFA